jgi:protocatechuate 3,4-dioxygenase alpha subunit
MAGATPSQTVGPFFSFGLCANPQHELVAAGHAGAIRLGGRVFDGDGEPVPDAMVEIWQPPVGWGRSGTDAAGGYGFVTVKPSGEGAPSVALLVFARGLMRHLATRMYFPHERRNDDDPLLLALSVHERAALTGVAVGLDEIRFDIHLQGERQTPFFVT